MAKKKRAEEVVEAQETQAQETITVDGVDYVIADLPTEIQLKIRQYVICQQRLQEQSNEFNKIYDQFMIEKSILDTAMAQYSNEISVALKTETAE
jgi:hypothetical protein